MYLLVSCLDHEFIVKPGDSILGIFIPDFKDASTKPQPIAMPSPMLNLLQEDIFLVSGIRRVICQDGHPEKVIEQPVPFSLDWLDINNRFVVNLSALMSFEVILLDERVIKL